MIVICQLCCPPNQRHPCLFVVSWIAHLRRCRSAPACLLFLELLTCAVAGQLIVALYTAGGVDHVAYMHADLLAVDLTGAAHAPSETVPCTVTAYQVRSSSD